MPTISATLINLYHVCQRECWLHSNGINMEQNSDIVYDGKLLHETSYPQRSDKHTEIELSATYNGYNLTGKIDFYDAKLKRIHEIKRSDKAETAHEWQAKFYIWILSLNGIYGAEAIIEYPKIRETKHIIFTDEDESYLQKVVGKISHLIKSEICPQTINAKICKNCSYNELCYIS